MAANLKELYVSTVAPSLMKKFSYKSVMQIPKIDKVVINVGAGEAKDNSKVIDAIMNDLALITGQKPVVCRAKKSVANFKIREGMPIGVKVTLRGEKMYEFLDRLFNVAFPPCTRLQRNQRQLLRRQRKLLHRYQGAAHFPRN